MTVLGLKNDGQTSRRRNILVSLTARLIVYLFTLISYVVYSSPV